MKPSCKCRKKMISYRFEQPLASPQQPPTNCSWPKFPCDSLRTRWTRKIVPSYSHGTFLATRLLNFLAWHRSPEVRTAALQCAYTHQTQTLLPMFFGCGFMTNSGSLVRRGASVHQFRPVRREVSFKMLATESLKNGFRGKFWQLQLSRMHPSSSLQFS